MIELFHGPTPNVYKVSIALEEMELPFYRTPIDLLNGEQYSPKFLVVNPNGKVPAIIDHRPAGSREPVTVFESGSILIYLACKSGRFLPTEVAERAATLQWLMWQMAGLGPMAGQFGHFRNYAPETIAYAITRYDNELRRLYRVLDDRLHVAEYLSGADYSIADMAVWPWIMYRTHHGIYLDEFVNIERWYKAIDARPALQRALGDNRIAPRPPSLNSETFEILFGGRADGD
jgi:GST-like protein